MNFLAGVVLAFLLQGPVIPAGSIGITQAGATLFTVVERQSANSNTACATGLTVTLGTATTGTTQGIFLTYDFTNPSGAITITDSGSQTYTAPAPLTSVGAHDTTGIAYFLGSAAGITSITIKVATSATFCALVVEHVTRTSGSWSLDQTGTASSIGVTTPWSSPAVTTTATNEFLFGNVLAYHTTGGNCVLAPTGLWAMASVLANNGNALGLLDQSVSTIQSNIQATGTTGTCTTFGGAGNYPGIRTFK